jgi:hypothetical protein
LELDAAEAALQYAGAVFARSQRTTEMHELVKMLLDVSGFIWLASWRLVILDHDLVK